MLNPVTRYIYTPVMDNPGRPDIVPATDTPGEYFGQACEHSDYTSLQSVPNPNRRLWQVLRDR